MYPQCTYICTDSNKNISLEAGPTETAAPETGVGESPSVAQLQNKANRDQQYLAARAQHPAPTHHYKHASNGNRYDYSCCI